MKYVRGGATAFVLGALTACATTGSTLGSGVGDTYLEHPPFYAGRAQTPTTGVVGYLPVAYQRGASQAEIFDPELTPELQLLLADMTAYMAEMGGQLRAVHPGNQGALRPPDVRFGCPTDTGFADDDCAEREGEALGRGRQPMLLAVGRPSSEWVEWSAASMSEAGVDRLLVVTVEVGQYWIRQRGFRGTKEVELGTGHTVRFPWLTSLEGPVAVVQITGALVGPDGKAIRIGAEGLLARRTPMKVSALGATALITDEEMGELRHLRRDDVPGHPLVWQEALRVLVGELTGVRSTDGRPQSQTLDSMRSRP